ncbi:hypothetical protein Pfo_018264 [Paulownia fortunei]|nr:hypothetical protein Pfo_018264 [Paulownia fortunei]
MAVNAYDVQVCLWKILKLSSKTCVTFSIKYPFVSFSLLCLFLLYMSFPLAFWVLIYSFPFVVCTSIILSISFSLGNVKKYKDEEEEENDGKYSRKTKYVADDSVNDKNKKSFARVHSVRRRRAKDIRREDNMQYNVEEKNAVSSTNFNYDMVDKNALIEESPKEIREVEVDCSLVNSPKCSSSSASQSLKHEFDEGEYQTESLEGLKDEEEGRDDGNKAKQGNEDDHQKNVMDVGISDIERNKRLESLIARRRSRKLLSLEVRRTLLNMDRNDHPAGQMASIVIPKNNNTTCFLPSNVVAGQFSPGPGSAPSVLIPMRNPFDLPYDPQEEKPDLTGDSFQQEFMSANNRDMMFCRHESFSLGAFLPREFNLNWEETSLVHDLGFRQRASSPGYQFSKPGNEFDREFAPIVEQESYEVCESKSTNNSPDDDDHIKEIIQVYENGIHSHSEEEEEEEEDIDEVQTRPIPEEDISSEEDAPIFKIDKEAILKSLSSMARRNAVEEEEMENNEHIGEHLSYGNTGRLKEQFCYADMTMRHHTPSYSIASDLQVEVSEVSSPPLTIDENLSDHDEDISTYDGDMEKKMSFWDSEDSWAGLSHLDLSQVDENESRSTQVNEVSEQDIIKVGFSRINKPEDTTLSNFMEQPLNEKHCILSSSSNAEFPDSGQSHSTNLHEKIHETFQTSEDNIYRIEQSATIASKTDEQIVGQFEKLDESYDSEQLAAESTKSSEDSEERLKPEHEEMVNVSTNVENRINLESIQHSEGEQSSAEVSIIQTSLHSNDPQTLSLTPNVAVEHVQSSSVSPKSVLLPTFSLDQGSLSSFDHDIDEEVQELGAQSAEVLSPVAFQNTTALMEHSTALPCFDGDVEGLQESSEPSKRSTVEADDTESVNKQKIHENGVKPKEVASGSSQIPGSHEAPAEATEEISSRSFNNNDEVSGKNFEAANPTAFSESLDVIDNSNSSISTEEELSKHQEVVIGEATHNDSNNSSSYEDQRQDSALHEDMGHEHYLKKPRDHERRTHSTTSNCFDRTKDEIQNFDADETPVALSCLVEGNDESESHKKNEHDRKAQQHANSHESMPVPEHKREAINTLMVKPSSQLHRPNKNDLEKHPITWTVTEDP